MARSHDRGPFAACLDPPIAIGAGGMLFKYCRKAIACSTVHGSNGRRSDSSSRTSSSAAIVSVASPRSRQFARVPRSAAFSIRSEISSRWALSRLTLRSNA